MAFGQVFQQSPGVAVREIDATTRVPVVSVSIGAMVGIFNWGPVDEVTQINSSTTLQQIFGKPDELNYKDWFSAENFLGYTNNLKVVRSVTANAINATDAATATVTVKNIADWQANEAGILASSATDHFIAKYPGTKGNDIVVEVADHTSFQHTTIQYTGLTGTLTNGDTITNGTATGTLVSFTGTQMTISGTTGGTFASGDALTGSGGGVTGATAGAIGTVSAFTTTHLGAATYDLTQEFDFVPSATEQAVVIIDTKAVKNGNTFTPTIVEKYILSIDPTSKDFQGTSNYILDVLANKSKYVWCAFDFVGGGNVPIAGTYVLAQGVDSAIADVNTATYTGTNALSGWGLFSDAESLAIDLCLQGGSSTAVATWIDQNICQVRKDCILFVSPQEADVVNALSVSAAVQSAITTRNAMGSTSYSFMDGNYKYQYDRFNDKYRWLPLNGDIAGLAARTDQTNDPWYSPAGFNRGNIKNVIKLAFNPRRSFRDTLFSSQINPVVNFSGQGPILFGDKTLLSLPSAFDRINVRRLFIILEKSITIAATAQLFEFNDAYTRARFVQMVEPFLRDVKGRRGIYDFRVIADTTNNTPTVIDSNNFVGDIYIKPARSINFITLNMIATPTGVAFTEIIG